MDKTEQVYPAWGVVKGVVPMERFMSALSLTLLLTGLFTIAQVQSPPEAANRAVEVGLTTDFDGKVRHEETISRAELAHILVKTFELHERSPQPQPIATIHDVPPSHWAYDDIQLVLRHGIMTGYREGQFYPEQRVTRAEAFAIFAQAHGVFQFSDQAIDRVLAPYPDAKKIPYWARKPMATAVHEGFVNLKTYNRLDPLSPMTREDLAYAITLYLARQQPSSKSLWQAIRPNTSPNTSTSPFVH
ncbi:S-layer homology domain-containing protein [Thermocoleostomius sinensis]|uniref:S-layer homology domain-containing protein n=1 Tax=Thermocoleostomius sinensis A174 TaxID=2016057 RepID=A0A9E8ZAY4_9CYAN|nr:S-layer homology domain-containing protein [Thermocoleostomius sinensis]WAL59803.1 S-layer homology domain-containing protein [Thermocoleostomius sinensis A174]